MTGAELYALYAEEHDARGCIVDTWDEMDDLDRSVWDALVKHLDITPPRYFGAELP